MIWILQPDESGLDASPQFDPIWGRRAQGLPDFVELVRHNREREFRIEAVRGDGDPVVCEVMTNVIHGLSRLALGLPSITPALIARCYDEPSGLFLPAVMPAISSRIPVTVAALSPLALPDLPDEIGHRLTEYLFDKRRFWTEVPAPSVALDEPSFSLREAGFRVRLERDRRSPGRARRRRAGTADGRARRLGTAGRGPPSARRVMGRHGVGGVILHRFGMPTKVIAERQLNVGSLNTGIDALALVVFRLGARHGDHRRRALAPRDVAAGGARRGWDHRRGADRAPRRRGCDALGGQTARIASAITTLGAAVIDTKRLLLRRDSWLAILGVVSYLVFDVLVLWWVTAGETAMPADGRAGRFCDGRSR